MSLKDTSKHANSKKITIFRSGSYLARSQPPEVQEYLALSNVSVGSYFEGQGSTRIATGLTFKEQDILLPYIIDSEPDDRDFKAKVSEYYASLDTKIPHGTGVTLEIGLEEDNNAAVGKNNMPLIISDYLRWRVASGHPFMAANKEEADSNANKQYYIFDKSALSKKTLNTTLQKDTALKLYLEIKEEASKVEGMLTVMGIDPRKFTGANAANDKTQELRRLAEEKPEDFATAYTTGDLDTRYFIQSMVNTRVIKKMGSKYFDGDTNKLLSNSLEELVAWFKDDENSEEVIMYKARMQEALKTPYVEGTRKTEFLNK